MTTREYGNWREYVLRGYFSLARVKREGNHECDLWCAPFPLLHLSSPLLSHTHFSPSLPSPFWNSVLLKVAYISLSSSLSFSLLLFSFPIYNLGSAIPSIFLLFFSSSSPSGEISIVFSTLPLWICPFLTSSSLTCHNHASLSLTFLISARSLFFSSSEWVLLISPNSIPISINS